MYVLNEEEINPLIQNHSQIPVPKQISRLLLLLFFGLKYFLGMSISSLSFSFLSITIVNIALFVLNFLNILQRGILIKAEKHFKTIKGHLPSFAYLISRWVN